MPPWKESGKGEADKESDGGRESEEGAERWQIMEVRFGRGEIKKKKKKMESPFVTWYFSVFPDTTNITS